jgi:hypothetical protein
MVKGVIGSYDGERERGRISGQMGDLSCRSVVVRSSSERLGLSRSASASASAQVLDGQKSVSPGNGHSSLPLGCPGRDYVSACRRHSAVGVEVEVELGLGDADCWRISPVGNGPQRLLAWSRA